MPGVNGGKTGDDFQVRWFVLDVFDDVTRESMVYLMELRTTDTDGSPREYTVTGEGVFLFSGSDQRIGKLLASGSNPDDPWLVEAMRGRKVMLLPVNRGEQANQPNLARVQAALSRRR